MVPRWLRLAVAALQFCLRRGQTRHRPGVRRAGNVVQPARSEEADRLRVAAVLAADSYFEVGVRRPSLVRSQLYELANAFLVDRLEGVPREDLLVHILRKEGAGVV